MFSNFRSFFKFLFLEYTFSMASPNNVKCTTQPSLIFVMQGTELGLQPTLSCTGLPARHC